MDRIRFRLGRKLALLLMLPALLLPSGCGWMSVVLYNMNPDDTPAEFKDLADKRMAIVCRPVVELQFSDSTVPRDLTREVGSLLTDKVHKIKIVDEREVSEWTDENAWRNFTEVGPALKADIVVGIELERFSLQQGPTLFQGNASLRLVVYDMQNGGRQVYRRSAAAHALSSARRFPRPTSRKPNSGGSSWACWPSRSHGGFMPTIRGRILPSTPTCSVF